MSMIERLLGVLFPGVAPPSPPPSSSSSTATVDPTTTSSLSGRSNGNTSNIDEEIQELEQKYTGDDLQDAMYKLRRNRLIKLLFELQNTSLRAKDMIVLRDTCQEYVRSFNLQKETDLINSIQTRFSMEYVPGISKLRLDKYKSDLPAAIIIPSQRTSSEHKSSLRNSSSASLAPLLQLPSTDTLNEYLEGSSPIPKSKRIAEQKQISVGLDLYRAIHGCTLGKTYLICSVKRHQSTLWVSYRMFLEGFREFDEDGNLSGVTSLDKPVMIFGAKKFKSGISPICYIWKSVDSKMWKEKNAVAKIIHQGNKYVGIPQMSTNVNIGNDGNVPTDSTTLNDLGDGDEDDPTQTQKVNEDKDIIQATQEEINISELMKGGPIVVTADCRGMEKMIHAYAVFPRILSESECRNLDEDMATRYITEIENMIGEPSKFSIYARKFHILRNRMPRKVPIAPVSPSPNKRLSTTPSRASAELAINPASNSTISSTPNKKTQLALDFGKYSRVCVASRKNLVMEEIFNERGELLHFEWSQDTVYPCFQLGKSKENVFALDFYGMSPFQAFVLAISVFNQ